VTSSHLIWPPATLISELFLWHNILYICGWLCSSSCAIMVLSAPEWQVPDLHTLLPQVESSWWLLNYQSGHIDPLLLMINFDQISLATMLPTTYCFGICFPMFWTKFFSLHWAPPHFSESNFPHFIENTYFNLCRAPTHFSVLPHTLVRVLNLARNSYDILNTDSLDTLLRIWMRF